MTVTSRRRLPETHPVSHVQLMSSTSLAATASTISKPGLPFPVPPNFAYDSMLELPAVRAFVKTFQKDKKHWNELLEATMCYGIHCLSMNYSLQSLTLQEVQDLVKENVKHPREYYKRRPPGFSTRDGPPLSPSRRSKASTTWRGGDIARTTTNIDQDFSKGITSNSESYQEPMIKTSVLSGKIEIDTFKSILGENFVDSAWKAFVSAGYPNRSLTHDGIQKAFETMRNMKSEWIRQLPTPIPEDCDTISFARFLRGYIRQELMFNSQPEPMKKSMSNEESSRKVTNQMSIKTDDLHFREERSPVDSPPSRAKVAPSSQLASTKPVLLSTVPPQVPQKAFPLSKNKTAIKKSKVPDKKASNGGEVPRYLRDVKSKIKDQVDQHRNKLSRVKKTQSQILRESLARERLREYNKPINERKTFTTRLGEHLGATAVEIAETFCNGPFLDKFRQETTNPSLSLDRDDEPEKDVVDEEGLTEMELYADSIQSSGEVVELANDRSKGSHPKPRRAFTGWLGDFGPRHTRTVVHGEWDSDDEEDLLFLKTHPLEKRRSKAYAWNFDEIEKAAETQLRGPCSTKYEGDDSFVDSMHHSSGDDDMASAKTSNPAFAWVKTELHA